MFYICGKINVYMKCTGDCFPESEVAFIYSRDQVYVGLYLHTPTSLYGVDFIKYIGNFTCIVTVLPSLKTV
jgi:hypothetical protein